MISETNPSDIMQAFDIINHRARGYSHKDLADAISVPKSTIFDRKAKYQKIVDTVIEGQIHGQKETAILNQIFVGKCSVRDATRIVNMMHEDRQLHRDKANKTLVSLSEAAEKINQKDRNLDQLGNAGMDAVSHTTDAGTSGHGALKNKYQWDVHIRDLFHVLRKLNKACKRVEN